MMAGGVMGWDGRVDVPGNWTRGGTSARRGTWNVIKGRDVQFVLKGK